MLGKKTRTVLAGALVCLLIFCGGLETQVWGAQGLTRISGTLDGRMAHLVFLDLRQGLTAVPALAENDVTTDKAVGEILRDESAAYGLNVAAAVGGLPAGTDENGSVLYAAVLKDGVLVNSHGSEPVAAIGFGPEGQVIIDKVQMSALVTFGAGKTVIPGTVNQYAEDPSAVMLFTQEMTLPVTCSSEALVAVIEDGQISRVQRGGVFTVAGGASVLVYNEEAAERAAAQGALPEAGMAAAISARISPQKTDTQAIWDQVTNVLSGGPAILLEGKNVLAQEDESLDTAEESQKSFAAVMGDGRLLLGACNASYDSLAAYLITLGADSAISLGQGASSMLYADGAGYLQVPFSRLSNALVILDENSPLSTVTATAVPTASPVLINGLSVQFDAYNIEGNNYFKLRDLAFVLNSTKVRFDVTWDGPRNSISLTSGVYYTPVGGEMASKGTEEKTASPTQSKIYLDGESVSLRAYLIDGNNYFMLRDLARALDFSVVWDEETRTVLIDANSGYTP